VLSRLSLDARGVRERLRDRWDSSRLHGPGHPRARFGIAASSPEIVADLPTAVSSIIAHLRLQSPQELQLFLWAQALLKRQAEQRPARSLGPFGVRRPPPVRATIGGHIRSIYIYQYEDDD